MKRSHKICLFPIFMLGINTSVIASIYLDNNKQIINAGIEAHTLLLDGTHNIGKRLIPAGERSDLSLTQEYTPGGDDVTLTIDNNFFVTAFAGLDGDGWFVVDGGGNTLDTITLTFGLNNVTSVIVSLWYLSDYVGEGKLELLDENKESLKDVTFTDEIIDYSIDSSGLTTKAMFVRISYSVQGDFVNCFQLVSAEMTWLC